jgi:hypothetical protein
VAAPSSYHDFTGPEPLAYDVPGTDKGNEWKITKVGVSLSERREKRNRDGKEKEKEKGEGEGEGAEEGEENEKKITKDRC